jgi:acyl-CoA synthetase (NDP forming)
MRAPAPGVIGLFCQSAPATVALADTLARRGLGASAIVSAGHRADVSGNDVMQFWTDDPATEVVLLHLESVGNPRKFTRVARRLSARKPVVTLIAGRTGPVVPPGHAVRSTHAPRVVLDEMLRQAGVIRAENVHHQVDVAELLAHQPLPRGGRVGVLASDTALAMLVADAAAARGLEVVASSDGLAREYSIDEIEASLGELYADGVCDAVVIADVPVVGDRTAAITSAVARAAAQAGRTTLAVMTGLHGVPDALAATGPDGGVHRVPAFATSGDAIAALASAVAYSTWRERDRGALVQPEGIDRRSARGLVAAHLAQAGSAGVVLNADTARELLGCYGIAVASGIGQPGGVAVVVRSAEDPLFGPVVSFGLAGDAIDLLGDEVFAVAPLTSVDVSDLVRAVRAAPKLFAADPAVDTAALEDLIARVSCLADDIPELAALELRPVVVQAAGLAVTQATVRLGKVAQRRDPLRRAL